MYCKYCGKELKDTARFCDRCGQSVRKAKEGSQAARHREIEELKAERLNRKKRLEEKEARQQERKSKKRKKKRGGGVIIFLIIIILIAVLSIIIGYNIFPSDGGIDNASETASPSAAAGEVTPTPAASASADKYSEITVGNINIPYPSDFYTNTASGNEKLNIVDSLGGATMIVAQEARNGEITELIKEYIASIGANDSNGGPEMRAGSDWYSVTAEVDGKVYHRKCIVRNGLAVYYDFTYDSASTSSKKYEDHISYIDSKFK